jgi:hypothetical protein
MMPKGNSRDIVEKQTSRKGRKVECPLVAYGILLICLLGRSSAIATSSDANIHHEYLQVGATGTLAAGKAPSLSSLTYYVDGLKGNDHNAGTTPEEAWQSIARINQVDFNPGDQLLFAGGQAFDGTLRFGKQCAGAKDRPILVSSFGQGRTTIKANAADGLVLTDCEYVVIKEVNVLGCGRKNGSNGAGISLTRTRHVNLNAIEVSGFRLGGVVTGGDQNTRITHVYAHDNGFAGITTYGGYDDIPRSRDLYIGYCVAENNPGDPENLTNHSGNGIVGGGVDNAVIEYCQAMNNGWDMPRKGNGPVGIWGWDCDRLVIQHCISHDNKTASGANDGGGFDLDGGATRSILQYNLSYNNHGCGYFFCQFQGAKRWENNTCRYNISINDGVTNQFCGILIWADDEGMSNAQIYNNVVINSRCAIYSHDIPGLVFHNNILIADKAVVAGRLNQAIFINNLYHIPKGGAVYQDLDHVFKTPVEWSKATGKETIDGRLTGFTVDPRLVLPADISELPTDPRQLKNMPFYRLQTGSPCIGVGTIIEDNDASDFFGNPIPSNRRPSLGVHEPSR